MSWLWYILIQLLLVVNIKSKNVSIVETFDPFLFKLNCLHYKNPQIQYIQSEDVVPITYFATREVICPEILIHLFFNHTTICNSIGISFPKIQHWCCFLPILSNF